MEIIYKNEKYISIEEVLEALNMKEYQLYRKIKKQEIPAPFKPEPRAYWKKSDIEEYLKNRDKN